MRSNGPIPTHPHLLQTLFDDFPLGIVLSDGQGHILRSNAMAQELLGLPAEAQQERDIAGPQWDIVRLDGSPMPAAEFASVRAQTEGCVVRDVEMGVARPDGSRIWLSVTAAPVEDGLVAVTFENIGPRIRGAAVMQAHGRLVERAEELGLEAMLRATLDELETLTGSCIGFYHFVLEDQETLHLQAWSTRTEAEFCRAEGKGAHYPVGQAGIWADAVREKRPVIHNDYASAPGKRGLPEGHAVVLRELVVPVLRNGQVRAVLGVGNKPTPYDDGDVASVQRLANLAWELAALKLARLAAERRAEQIETVSASTPGLIHAFRLGPEGRITMPYLSAAAEELYGLDPGAVAADFHAVLDRSPAEDRERLWEAGMASARDLTPHHLRWRYDHPSKGLRWLETWSMPRREPDGGTLWHGITMDSTALVEAEQALQKSDMRYRMLAENASDVIWTMDLEGRFTYVSPSIQRLRGYTAEEVMSQSFLDALTPESAQIAAREYARSLEVLAAGGAFPAFRGEMEQPCKDGSTVWTEVTTTGLHDETGHLVGVLGVSRDITARRKAEEVLRESEARFRQISEASGDWIWEVDAEGLYTYSSQGIERFLGYRPEDLVGRFHFWDLWPTEEREALLPAVQEVFRNRAPIRHLSNTALHKDGRRVRLETTGLPIHGPGGEFLGYRGVDHDVTEREASQEALRRSEERFSKAFHQNPVPMAIARAADQRMVEVNDSWVKLSGMTREMAVGEVLAETRLIPDAEERAKLQRSFKPTEPLHALPIRIVRLDGQPRTVHMSAQLTLLGGEPCVVISAQDVSEQLRAEEALRESAFHLREAQKLAQVGHWTVDHRTGTTRWSEQLYAIHGRDPALPPPAWEEFQRSFHPGDLAAMRSNYEGHLASRHPSARFGYRIILADGRVRHIRSECRTEYDGEGRPLRTFGTDQDITDLVRTQVALQESEGRFRGLWEHAPVAVMEEDYSAVKARCDEWRREGVGNLASHLELHPQAARDLAALVRVVEVNSATLRLFGAPDAEALVRGLPDCFGEDALPAFKAHLAALYAGQQSTEHESSARDLQGQQLNLQVRVSVVPGHEHDLGRVLVSFSDLTERKATEADRRRLERELNHLQRLESLGRLAGGVSHDMNNVLGAIMAVGSLLKVRHRDTPAIVKDAEALLQAAIRGRDLVKGLRDFSRKELESATELDLNDLARREADLLERTTLKRVAVDLDLAPELAKVYGEGSTISNALMNLCLNACDAMPHGGTVTLSTRNLGEGFVEMAVQDTGEGMPPDVLARATEPFFTTKPAGKGTGLGLSQVYGTMKAHGGTLDIQSRPGRGTRVSLSFPVSAAAPPASPEGEAGPAPPPRTLRILLVDDEELIRRTFMLLLEAMGHEVQTASGGLDALRRVEAGLEADLAVLDVNMPGMDGLETLSRLRILRPELPVVIATGFADERIPGILRRFPKVRILKKPFGISDLEKLFAAWP